MNTMDPVHFTRTTRLFLPLTLLATMAALAMLATGARASWTLQSGVTYASHPPADPSLNQLDVYRPSNPPATASPLVVYVHGGGWRRGDKAVASTLDKANLFTGAGYVFASINYRLSPETGDPNNPDPDRIRFPVHPDDVGEAIGWLSRNAGSLGADPDRIILIGHSAGAHLVSLVSVDPRYIGRNGVDQRQILGTIPLDTAAFSIERAINRGTDPDEPNLLFINAFGTAEENAAEGTWAEASPLTWADPSDPEHLFITQSIPYRIAESQEMSDALGQGPGRVVPVPLNHNGVNQAVGAPGDSSGTTAAITSFIDSLLAGYKPASVSIRKRPAKVVRTGRKARSRMPKKRKVVFAFSGSGNTVGFECRLDKAPFKACKSPRRYTVPKGNHSFRVRPVYPSGRPGANKLVKFQVKAKKKSRR
jgi:arylformamidase